MNKKYVYFFFIKVFLTSICIEKIKQKEKKRIGCENLLYFYSKQKDCIEKDCIINKNKMKEDESNEYLKYDLLEICKRDLLEWFKRKSGKIFDIENPITFNEKIQWLKLYDSTPLKTKLADKYLARDWIKKNIGENFLVPLIGVWDSFEEIKFDLLPEKFVLKANHGCSYNIIVQNKSLLNLTKTRNTINKWMAKNFAFQNGFEFHYLNIKPKIIAEEYLEKNDEHGLYDYRVYCFNGKANSIGFFSDTKKNWKIAFYDLEWNKLNYYYNYKFDEKIIPKPKYLNLLIEISEKIAKNFSFVRVDFYILNNGTVKIGEITFTPTSGIAKWIPPEQDNIFGNMLKLPSKKILPLYIF